MASKSLRIRDWGQRTYLVILFQVVGRALAAASRADPQLRSELKALPEGYVVQMTTPGDDVQLALRARGDGVLERLAAAPAPRADLVIRFKHRAHAFLVFSFQEGTARAFANDRMIADGDVAVATRLVRCLDRLQTLILPAFVARRAVKRYRAPAAWQKLALALRIYGGVARSLLVEGH